jgi:hypothetical protein
MPHPSRLAAYQAHSRVQKGYGESLAKESLGFALGFFA